MIRRLFKKEKEPRSQKGAVDSAKPSSTTNNAMAPADELKPPEPNQNAREYCIESDLICPITLDLPIDPVTAEDGRIYERDAIESHFSNQADSGIRSPLTNMPMGQRLLPSSQTKNVIQALIDQGVVSGELADSWLERRREKKKVEDLIARANSGEVCAMEWLGHTYFHGKDGVVKNESKAVETLEPACHLGSLYALQTVGWILLHGKAIKRDQVRGIMYLSLAAGKGSDWAAYKLGLAFAKGSHGLSVDEGNARLYLTMALGEKCSRNSLVERQKLKARETLDQLTVDRLGY
jgi:U-box domain/Sel1 repeat